MSKSKTEKLQAMMGKHFKNKHNDEIIKFFSFNQVGDEITISTNKDWIKTTPFELNILFQQYEEVENIETGVVVKKNDNELMRPVLVPDSAIKDLKDVLLDNIEKVKENKDYVGQAKAISNSVAQIINLAKLQIEMRAKL